MDPDPKHCIKVLSVRYIFRECNGTDTRSDEKQTRTTVAILIEIGSRPILFLWLGSCNEINIHEISLWLVKNWVLATFLSLVPKM
jgi:hypothetical protein